MLLSDFFSANPTETQMEKGGDPNREFSCVNLLASQ